MLTTSLDIARGLAAVWVFLYHMRLGIEPGAFRCLADGGFLGVPLFFVISGYCMMASSRRVIAKQQPSSTFLQRRLWRIFPPFWASVLVVMAAPFVASLIYWSHGGGLAWPSPKWSSFSAIDWIQLVTLTKGLFRHGQAHLPYRPVNAVYWTLAIEVQFYLVMYAALLLRKKFHTVLIGVTAMCLGLCGVLGPFQPGLFPEYWPMFALGLLLYVVLERGLEPVRWFGRHTHEISLVLLLLVAAGTLAATMYLPSESLARQTVFAFCCGLMLWAATGVEVQLPRQWLASKMLTGLGKMSYSVYLLHIHLVPLVMIFVTPLAPRGHPLWPFFNILGTLAPVYVFYRYCEKPYIRARRA